MESVRLRSSEGKAKVVGTMLGVGGALVFIFYRGKTIPLWSTHVDLVNQTRDSSTHHISIFGALLVFGGYLSYSLWLLLQVSVFEFSSPYVYVCLLKHIVWFWIKRNFKCISQPLIICISYKNYFVIGLDNIKGHMAYLCVIQMVHFNYVVRFLVYRLR